MFRVTSVAEPHFTQVRASNTATNISDVTSVHKINACINYYHAHIGPGFRIGVYSLINPGDRTLFNLYFMTSSAFSSGVLPSRRMTLSRDLGCSRMPDRPRPLISIRFSFGPFSTQASACWYNHVRLMPTKSEANCCAPTTSFERFNPL